MVTTYVQVLSKTVHHVFLVLLDREVSVCPKNSLSCGSHYCCNSRSSDNDGKFQVKFGLEAWYNKAIALEFAPSMLSPSVFMADRLF